MIVSAVILLAADSVCAQKQGTAGVPLKSTGRELQNAPSLRPGTSLLRRVPSKAEVYGSASVQGHSEVCPSVAPPDSAAMLKAPKKAEGGRTAQALLIYSDSKGVSNCIVELPITSGAIDKLEVVAENVPLMPYKAYGEAVVNAVAFDDKYMASTFCEMMYSQTNSVYTTADWKHQYNYDYRLADLESPCLTYNPADGICYGVFQGINPATGSDEWFFGRWIDASSYTQPEPIRFIGTDSPWFGMTATPDGVIYAIDNECNLIKVDAATGETTKIGATGLQNKYKTSACYDAVNDRILFATSLDTGSAMNSIDIKTGRATMLYAMPDGEQVVGMFIPDPLAPDKAPAAVSNLTPDFALGSLSGTINFDVPSTLYDGTTATGNVNYEVRIDGEITATGTAAYGSKVKAPVQLSQSKDAVVAVRLSNSAGKSPVVRATLFCGTPKPRVPHFSKKATYNEAEKCFELEWAPNPQETGTTGGTVANNDLTYELTRYPDKKVITTQPGVLSIKDPYTPDGDKFGIVYYELRAVYYGTKSEAVKSNPTKFGIITPPYVDEMMNSMSSAAYTYLPTASDDLSWSYIGAVTQQDKQHGWMNHGAANSSTPMDSYLVMAPMRLEKGKVYTLSFTAACTNTSWRNERLAVYMGTEISVSGLRQQTLIEPTLIYERREENGERHSCNFSAPSDGIYYIAFHHCSDPNLRYLYIGDISISAPVDGQVPSEVSNLQVTAAGGGALSATISFTMPTKSVNGQSLTEPTKVKIIRNDEQIADATSSGSTYTYTDNKAVNGVNNYIIVPYNSKGDGLKSTANVFVGVGKPKNPQPHAWYGDNDGQAKVTWPAVATDEFGTQLNSSNVRYEVQRETVVSGETQRKLMGQNITDTQFVDQFCDPSAEQNAASYWVRSVTDGGNSQWVSTRKVGLGKPYETPWFESFTNTEGRYKWYSVGSDIQWMTVDDAAYDDVKSVDGDNGFILCQAAKAGTPGLLYSGAIDIPADIQNPVLSFYYLNQDKYQGQPVQNMVEMVILDSEGQKHVKQAVCNGPWGWERMVYDMSKYKGQKVQVGVYVECIDRPNVVLDAFRLATRYAIDIDMVALRGPEEVTVGQDATLTVTYENLGSDDIAAGYMVELYHGDKKVAEKAGEAIKADAKASVNFTVKTNPTLGEEAEYHAVVKVDADNNADNNTSNTFTLKINNNIGYPEPQNLFASRPEVGVSLTWEAPDMSKTPRKTYTEDFEKFDSFAKEIPDWTILDEDKGIVSPISNYIQTSETWGSPFGFFVQDNSVAPFNQYTEFTAASGHKYMASQHTADDLGNDIRNDDWLISPELSGDMQVATFMGKSISSSWPEAFEVYYSLTGKEKDDFQLIGGVAAAPNIWVNYSATLPAGSRYFAIRCVSAACLQFMVDDVTLRLKSCDPIELTLKGYNIYRDGVLVNAEPVKELAYYDAFADNSEHKYMVTAVYKEGESVPSEAWTVEAGIDGVGSDGVSVAVADGRIVVKASADTPVTIYGISGVGIHNGMGGCTVDVEAGVYIVKVGGEIVKLIVK